LWYTPPVLVYTTITTEPAENPSGRELFEEDGVVNDLPRSTRALLAIQHPVDPGAALDVASFQGAVATAAGCTYLSNDLTGCQTARAAGVADTRHADSLPEGPFATVWFDAREYDPGLAAETVAQAAARLSPGGLLITTARRADVDSCFTDVTEQGEALVARGPVPGCAGPAWAVYDAEFDGASYRIQSGPGVFSPRKLDEGSAFMLSQIGRPEAGARFLDLGCGAGVVSRIATEAWGCSVTAVDVSARALRLTAQNAPRAEVLASDGFRALGARQFDIIATNPPYHTDFGVAKAFIEGAFAHLALGGMLYLVIKRADWYVQKVRSVFGGCRVATQNDYTVIVAERREPKPGPRVAPAEPATTKKHARRMAEAASRQKRHR
jgi:16S rRNA (guanine1207-N2)-methyltransferase